MNRFAAKQRKVAGDQTVEFPRVAFFCTLIKRKVVTEIGGLDERYSPGNFEDDDYCLRAQAAGFKTVIAKDVFVHHYGSKSFGANGLAKYQASLEKNRAVFVEKWGAAPEEIWLNNKPVRRRNLMIPLNADPFGQHFKLASILLSERDIQFADAELRKALACWHEDNKEGVDYADVLSLAGHTSLMLGDLESAKSRFEEELGLVNDSSRACVGLGQVFLAAGEHPAAKAMLEWGVKNDLTNKKARASLAKANQLLGLPSEDNTLLEQEATNGGPA
jgi:tetratricopeptide (TPR) repeat protein